MNLLLLEAGEIDDAGRARVGGARALHVVNVLGARAGSRIRVGIVNGAAGTAELCDAGSDAITLDCAELSSRPPPARPRLDLLLALPRPKVLGRLYEKLACLGVGRIALVNAARVERYYFDSHVLRDDYVRARLLSGLSQAGDTLLPEVSVHRSFRKLVEDELETLASGSRRVLFDLESGAGDVKQALTGVSREERVLVAVGPEGGWVDFERVLFERAGFRRASLGPRVLYADLAAVLALGAVGRELDQ